MEKQTNPQIPQYIIGHIPPTSSHAGTIFIHSGLRFHHVALTEILFVEGRQKICIIVTVRGRFIVMTALLGLEAMLNAPLFYRIHRSYLVGIAHIKSFDRKSVLIGEQELPIGPSYVNGLINARPLLGTGKPDANQDQ